MEIKVSEIKHFQQLYMTKFGIEIDAKTARVKLLKLVRQMQAVYQPVTSQQLQAYKAKNEHINENTDNGNEETV